MKNILTVNIEDYYQVGAFSQLIPYHEWERFEDRIRRNTDRTLKLLRETRAEATFFVSGWIAEKHPHLLRSVVDEGHEIAAQGYYQQSIRNAPPQVFREDVRRSRAIIEDATGREVRGFRVGRGWIGPDDLWAIDVLAEEGFAYDASVCPLGAQFRGCPQRFTLHAVGSGTPQLVEVPASSLSILGYAVPFAGGNYLRQLPLWMTRRAARHWVDTLHLPLVMYFHIWELDDAQPNITAAGALQRVRHYRNLGTMRERIRYLLLGYRFTSVRNYLQLTQDHVVTAEATPLMPPPANVPAAAAATGEARRLSIVVPCYNEEDSIAYLARTLAAFAAATAHSLELEIVLVDDGSTDGTWRALAETFGDDAHYRCVRHEHNRGIAAAILTGIRHSSADCVAVIDADCTFDPFQIEQMLPLLTDDVTVVVASPFHPHGDVRNVPSWRQLLSRSATALYARVFHHRLSSYTSCFRIYRRAALAEMQIIDPGFCGVTEILARLDLAGHRIVECPVVLQVRLLGQSKIRLLRVIADHLRLLARMGARRLLAIPLRFERNV